MKYLGGTAILLFLCISLWAQQKKAEELPQYQIVVFFTNALTGIKQDPYGADQEVRYGFNGGYEYNVKLLKWFSVGMGMAFMFHRSYSSFHLDSLALPVAPMYFLHLKSYKGSYTAGIVELPVRVIFSIPTTKKIEFQFAIAASVQGVVYENEKAVIEYYGALQYYDRNNLLYYFFFDDAIGYGLEMGPLFKMGRKKELMLQPEYRINLGSAMKVYSVGLKIGLVFDDNLLLGSVPKKSDKWDTW